jgi:hypothetical protein
MAGVDLGADAARFVAFGIAVFASIFRNDRQTVTIPVAAGYCLNMLRMAEQSC